LGLGLVGESITILNSTCADKSHIFRLVVILIGRLRLSPSKATEAYMKLVAVIPNEAAKNDEERKRNTEEFRVAFIEVLEDAGFDHDTLMMDEDGTKM
jgi:hypothetical protein